jgi:hypothetical protein
MTSSKQQLQPGVSMSSSTTSYSQGGFPPPLTTEPVGYFQESTTTTTATATSSRGDKKKDNRISNASSYASSVSSKFSSVSSYTTASLKRTLFFLVLGFLLYLLLSVIYQAMHSIYKAYNVANSKEGGIPDQIQAFINAHPSNKIGLWKQCNDVSGCGELQVWCNPDDIRNRLQAAGLLAKATQDQANEFVSTEAQLCPLLVASRSTSLISIFTAVLALIGLALAMRRNSKAAFLTATLGAFLTCKKNFFF